MHHDSFVTDLAIVLGVAAITGLVFRLLKQPSILGYLFAGLLVGPYLPVPLFADPKRVHALSEFGVVLVMFAVGLEFRLSKFFKVLPVSGLTGLVEISALYFGGYLLGQFLGWTEIGSLFLGACLCISSTMAVSKIFEQRPVAEDVRASVLGVLVLQDVAAIALIAIMTALSQGAHASFGHVLVLLGRLLAVLVSIVVVGMFVVPRAVRLLARTKSLETLVVGAIGLCFSLALLAEKLGYSAALGAFLAGVLVAESGLGQKVEHATAAVRDVFAAVFFVSIGMTVDPALAIKHLPTSLLVLGVVISLQFASVLFGGLLSGTGLRRSVAAGLALGQVGEFAFILAEIGRQAYVVGQELQPILVTVAVLSTFTTALLLRFAGPITSGVELLLPGRMRRLLWVYESWWDGIFARQPEKGRGVTTLVRAVLFDLLLAALIVMAFRVWQRDIEIYLYRHFHWGQQLVHSLASLALGLSVLPIFVLLAITARKLARKLAARVFLDKQSHGRSFFQGALFLAVLSASGLIGAAMLAPVVGAGYVWGGFLMALLATLVIVWRRAGEVETEMMSGGALLIAAIAEQGQTEGERETQMPFALSSQMREYQLSSGDASVGQTLAELQLRSQTGASVLALKGENGEARSPTGEEVLQVGDRLYLAGCGADQEAAVQLLSTGQLRMSSVENAL